MLSIIISTFNQRNYTALEQNIIETAGIPFEIIKVENPGTMGICDAYNFGAGKAKFENLLFLHDDISFQTINWGPKLIKYLKDPEAGVFGVAGSNYVPAAPSGWFIEKCQKDSTTNKTAAIALDGVFLSCTKTKFNQVKFNDSQIKGFHGYDCDFSLRMAKLYQNYIVHDINIEHFSSGNPDKLFLDNNIKIRLNLGSNFNHPSNSATEKAAFNSFLRFYFKYYPVTIRNLCFTMKFFPFSKTRRKDQLQIIKTYLKVIKHRKHQRII